MAESKYYQLMVTGKEAQLDIYGDITSWPWKDSDVSAWNLSQKLGELTDVDVINVNINSYGGEVAEGLAIYNALRNHPAHVVTKVDGFACSIASVIFMAGDERAMCESSLLMIHNAWTFAAGNAADLRKQAEDLDTITKASKSAYLSRVSIEEPELTALMDGESWISPDDAVTMGFATAIENYEGSDKPSQSARRTISEAIMHAFMEKKDDDDDCNCKKDDDDCDCDEEPEHHPVPQGEEPEEPDSDTEQEEETDTEEPPDEQDDGKEDKPSAAANLAAFLLRKN